MHWLCSRKIRCLYTGSTYKFWIFRVWRAGLVLKVFFTMKGRQLFWSRT